MQAAEPNHRRFPWGTVWPVYLAAPVVISGIEVILPALPGMQRDLGLSNAQIALVTSVYLLPSVFAAVPAGVLSDRFGRRSILSGALLVFGLGGAYLGLNPEAFGPMLIVRAIQGAASAVVLSLTITILGDVSSGREQVSAQAYRGISLRLGEAVWPVVGGALATLAWWSPFLAQTVAIPVAVTAWVGLSGPRSDPASRRNPIRGLRSTLSDTSILVLQAAGFLRFFFKLSLLTYLPVLAASGAGASAATIGLALAGAAVAGLASSPATGWLVGRVAPSSLLGSCLLVIATALGAMAVNPRMEVIVAAAVLFGLADGVYGVLINATTTKVVPADIRATFVGLSTSIRNLGKFTAPTLIGALVLFLPLRTAFAVVAAIALVSAGTALPFRALDGLVRPRADSGKVPADVFDTGTYSG